MLVLLLLEILQPLLLGDQLLLLHLNLTKKSMKKLREKKTIYLVLLPGRHPAQLLDARRGVAGARAHVLLGTGPIMHFSYSFVTFLSSH